MQGTPLSALSEHSLSKPYAQLARCTLLVRSVRVVLLRTALSSGFRPCTRFADSQPLLCFAHCIIHIGRASLVQSSMICTGTRACTVGFRNIASCTVGFGQVGGVRDCRPDFSAQAWMSMMRGFSVAPCRALECTGDPPPSAWTEERASRYTRRDGGRKHAPSALVLASSALAPYVFPL